MRLICHRGGRGFGDENTLQAMEAAVQAGVRAIEIDVRATADGELIVCHDPEVERLPVKKTPFPRIREEAPHVPMLREVLDILAGKIFFDLEIKDAPPERVVEMIDAYGALQDTVFTSFREDIVGGIKRVRPDARSGPVRWTLLEQNRVLHWMLDIGAELLVLHHRMTNEDNVAVLHALGLEIFAWTVNSEDDLRRMHSIGVDGAITDRYPEAARLLEELGPEDHRR